MAWAQSMTALKLTWAATRAASAVSTRLGGWFAYRLWFTPWRIPMSDNERGRQARWLAATEPFTVTAAGRRIEGFTAGEGPPVLLVHGWADRAARLGALVPPLVDAGYRVVGIDLPAHGRTSGTKTNVYEMQAAVEAAAAKVGDLHAVVAHSMGAVATLLAVRDGMPVRGLVFVAPPARMDRARELFEKGFRLSPRASLALGNAIERRFGREIWHEISAMTLVEEVDVPAIVFHDRDDDQVAHEDVKALVAKWPSARLVSTEGLGHGRVLRDEGVLTETRLFVDALREDQAAAQPVRG